MNRAGYSASIESFLDSPTDAILGQLVERSDFAIELPQRDAWISEVHLLRNVLGDYRQRGAVYFEFSVPRLGKRIDVLAIIDHVVFVLEFKVGERQFTSRGIEQVYDYALDLKNFHESSHSCFVAPVLIATEAPPIYPVPAMAHQKDRLLYPVSTSPELLSDVIRTVLDIADAPAIDISEWERGRYCPTPTIIEAATALYRGHSVADISRSDASATNLSVTSDAISRIIVEAQARTRKSICFVTGVPGAGKTLVGLNVATQYTDKDSDLYSVFLSGNGPLVAILREALARDKVQREREHGRIVGKGAARSEVKAFIQNVHHFRDDCLVDQGRPPVEHVALFDEAQRAWNLDQTSKFMRQKKGRTNFSMSEPEFLISCLDRHRDWAVMVCLVGGGQEINTGEAGISEWIESVTRSYNHWHVHISSRLTDSEYAAGQLLERVAALPRVSICDELHLGVSMRSFRSENVSLLVKQILDLDADAAAQTLSSVHERYPIVLTRSLPAAKQWLRSMARGSERYGIVVSSQAQRLKPYAIDVRSPMDPVHWFLDGKEDVRSSYYLEDVATEFHVQGLELDYACVAWDADFRHVGHGWEHWSFVGERWNRIRKPERQFYLKNAYRVLLTRARQGMVIVVPEGEPTDPTRHGSYYDSTYDYLRRIGFEIL
ncbi:MAG: DUF2075 domain-containing protein [Pirellulales bacterium]|nr:DUF2075 domain-containing protein [Pirellulales bacterium]